MHNLFISEILKDSGMLSLEQGMNIYHSLVQVLLLEIPGDVVELGCCHGLGAVLIQKTLESFNSKKQLHVYDGFQGLPEKHSKDGNTSASKGACNSNVGILTRNFEKYRAKLPKIHEGWFSDTLKTQLPDTISFAHLDGDFYTSIKESLEEVYPRLSPGALVIIDDYCGEEHKENTNNLAKNTFKQKAEPRYLEQLDQFPGVKQACDEYFKDKPEKVSMLYSGWAPHGYFRKV